MNIQDAQVIGAAKLHVDPGLFQKCLEVAKEMEVKPKDLGPMALILAILGVSKAHQSDDILEAEMMDAAELVAKAENEWNLERKARH